MSYTTTYTLVLRTEHIQKNQKTWALDLTRHRQCLGKSLNCWGYPILLQNERLAKVIYNSTFQFLFTPYMKYEINSMSQEWKCFPIVRILFCAYVCGTLVSDIPMQILNHDVKCISYCSFLVNRVGKPLNQKIPSSSKIL